MPEQKAYYVEKVGWAVKHVLVYSNTVEEATELVRSGEGAVIDTDYGYSTTRRARRAPEEDRDA